MSSPSLDLPRDTRAARKLDARQFVAGPPAREVALQTFRHQTFGASIPLAIHADLPVCAALAGEVELVLLGRVLDPRHPTWSDQASLAHIAQACTTFDALEQATASVGGRWLLFARIGRELRVYPDASGSKPLFYGRTHVGLWLASQPAAVPHSSRPAADSASIAKLWQAPSADAWPAAEAHAASFRRPFAAP